MEYSGTVEAILFAVWAIGSLLLAWFLRRRFYVFWGSVLLVAPAIGYSMVGYGFLEMGGIPHALGAALFVLPFHYLFKRVRCKKIQESEHNA